ncbi:protein NO VEIN domain-containing protein [Kocuria sp. U4B]
MYYETARGYIGVGVLGVISSSPDPDNSIVDILSYQPFDDVVGRKDPDNTYFEVDLAAGQKGVAWQSGVQRITQRRFEKILNHADGLMGSTPPETATHAKRPQKYAPLEVTQAVEQYSVAVVMDLLAQRHGADNVTEMSRNNPGFDIRLGDAGNPGGYFEVKGTQSSDPVFFLSEGECLLGASRGPIHLGRGHRHRPSAQNSRPGALAVRSRTTPGRQHETETMAMPARVDSQPMRG